MQHVQSLLRIGLMSLALAAALSINAPARPASAVSTGLWVAPADVAVTSGGAVTVQLMQHADVGTLGGEADVSFDRTRLQVTSVVVGAPYAAAQLFVYDLGAANTTTGVLSIGTFFMPGAGAVPVPAGDAVVATLTLAAVPGISAVTATAVSLSRPFLLDNAYEPILPLILTGGVVHVVPARDHKTDANGDGYSAADEVTMANCGVTSCASIITFGTAETNTCKDAGRNCGTPGAPVNESVAARVSVPPADGYGCSVTLDIVGPKTTVKLARSDVDLDGVVSTLDLSKVSSWYGNTINASTSDPRWEGDMDGDGVISILDLSAVSANNGRSVAGNCQVE